MDNYVEILGSTQGSGAPEIFQSAVSSRPAKIAGSESCVRRHRYNYRYDSDEEDGDKDFVASPPADNNFEDISDVKVVENLKLESQRRRVGTARGRGSAAPSSSAKTNSVRYANKHNIQLSAIPENSTKRTSVSSTNK